MNVRDLCAVCGGAEPFGLHLCAACGASSDVGDTLVFVRGAADAAERADRSARLASLIGGPAQTGVGDRAGRGRVPLMRLPAGLAPRVVERLETKGIPAHVLPLARAWSMMPAHFFLMIAAILGTGVLAGMGPLPAMRWLTPVTTLALLVAAQRAMQLPLLGNARHVPRLPAPAARAVRAAFAELDGDAPRRLLGDVVRVAQPVFAGAPRALGQLLSDLVVAACATALETERQGVVLAVLSGRSSGAAVAGAAERCERSRQEGVALLERAATALAQLGASQSPSDGVASSQEPLAELVKALEREAAAQAEAARDLEVLLRD